MSARLNFVKNNLLRDKASILSYNKLVISEWGNSDDIYNIIIIQNKLFLLNQ